MEIYLILQPFGLEVLFPIIAHDQHIHILDRTNAKNHFYLYVNIYYLIGIFSDS